VKQILNFPAAVLVVTGEDICINKAPKITLPRACPVHHKHILAVNGRNRRVGQPTKASQPERNKWCDAAGSGAEHCFATVVIKLSICVCPNNSAVLIGATVGFSPPPGTTARCNPKLKFLKNSQRRGGGGTCLMVLLFLIFIYFNLLLVFTLPVSKLKRLDS
jgi:hypothetical protein